MDGQRHLGMESIGKSLGHHFYVLEALRSVRFDCFSNPRIFKIP